MTIDNDNGILRGYDHVGIHMIERLPRSVPDFASFVLLPAHAPLHLFESIPVPARLMGFKARALHVRWISACPQCCIHLASS